jgi:DNA-binding NarL/FixJ family response regulator
MPGVRVLWHTTRTDIGGLLLALQAGAVGYLIDPIPMCEVIRAIGSTLDGFAPLCPEAQKLVVTALRHGRGLAGMQASLTRTEFSVMARLLGDECDKQIAQALEVSVSTVHAHRASIYRKLRVHSREEDCAAFASRVFGESHRRASHDKGVVSSSASVGSGLRELV